jgi:hypothetical protein
MCVCYNQRRASSKKHARPSKRTTRTSVPLKAPTHANRNVPTEDAVQPQQATKRCAKEATNKPQTDYHPLCKLQYTPKAAPQVAGDTANTMKQVNQLQETTATKATEPGKTNACPNPESAAHAQCAGTINNRHACACACMCVCACTSVSVCLCTLFCPLWTRCDEGMQLVTDELLLL